MGFSGEIAHKAIMAVQCYDDLYKRYVDPIRHHRYVLDKMLRWSHAGERFNPRWLCDCLSEELLQRDTKDEGRDVYYIRVHPGGLANPTDYTHQTFL